MDFDVSGRQRLVTLGARDFHSGLPPTPAVAIDERHTVRRQVLIAPCPECLQDRVERQACVGEPIFMPHAVALVGQPFEGTSRHQTVQSIRQQRARNTER